MSRLTHHHIQQAILALAAGDLEGFKNRVRRIRYIRKVERWNTRHHGRHTAHP